MKLGDVQKEIDAYSKGASDGARQFALAGIAIIWLFKTAKPDAAGIPFNDLLLFPLLGFTIALALDLAHYLVAAVLWTVFFRTKDKVGVNRESEIGKAWTYINWPGNFLFVAKILSVAASYSVLIAYVAKLL